MSVWDEWHLKCPKCGSDEYLEVVFKGTARLTSQGTEDIGDHEWDQESYMACAHCGHDGNVRDFDSDTPPNQDADSGGDRLMQD